MKYYQVELKYEAHTIINIEAESPEQAEEIAWQEIESDGSYGSYGEWTLESITDENHESI